MRCYLYAWTPMYLCLFELTNATQSASFIYPMSGRVYTLCIIYPSSTLINHAMNFRERMRWRHKVIAGHNSVKHNCMHLQKLHSGRKRDKFQTRELTVKSLSSLHLAAAQGSTLHVLFSGHIVPPQAAHVGGFGSMLTCQPCLPMQLTPSFLAGGWGTLGAQGYFSAACCLHRRWGWLQDEGQLTLLNPLSQLPCQCFSLGLNNSQMMWLSRLHIAELDGFSGYVSLVISAETLIKSWQTWHSLACVWNVAPVWQHFV